MSRFVLVQALVLIISIPVFSQTNGEYFAHSKDNGINKVVYFKIIGMPDDFDEQDRVLEHLLSDENIIDGNLFFIKESNQTNCQLEIKYGLTVSYIDQLLSSVGYEMNQLDIGDRLNQKEKPSGIYNSASYSFFDGFDGLKGYGTNDAQTISKEDYYHQKKEKWVLENPEKYKEVKQSRESKIVIREKDLNVYAQEKREYVLSHPEIYIIEE